MDICNRHGYDDCDCHVDVIRRRVACFFWTFCRTGPLGKRGETHMTFRFFQPCLNASVLWTKSSVLQEKHAWNWIVTLVANRSISEQSFTWNSLWNILRFNFYSLLSFSTRVLSFAGRHSTIIVIVFSIRNCHNFFLISIIWAPPPYPLFFLCMVMLPDCPFVSGFTQVLVSLQKSLQPYKLLLIRWGWYASFFSFVTHGLWLITPSTLLPSLTLKHQIGLLSTRKWAVCTVRCSDSDSAPTNPDPFLSLCVTQLCLCMIPSWGGR